MPEALRCLSCGYRRHNSCPLRSSSRCTCERSQRSLAGLRVSRTVILELAPGLGRVVQGGQRQIRYALEHGHEPPFNIPPGALTFTVLIHAAKVANLPPIHKDLFDRLLVAQARFEPMILLTDDEMLRGYGDFVEVV